MSFRVAMLLNPILPKIPLIAFRLLSQALRVLIELSDKTDPIKKISSS